MTVHLTTCYFGISNASWLLYGGAGCSKPEITQRVVTSTKCHKVLYVRQVPAYLSVSHLNTYRYQFLYCTVQYSMYIHFRCRLKLTLTYVGKRVATMASIFNSLNSRRFQRVAHTAVAFSLMAGLILSLLNYFIPSRNIQTSNENLDQVADVKPWAQSCKSMNYIGSPKVWHDAQTKYEHLRNDKFTFVQSLPSPIARSTAVISH